MGREAKGSVRFNRKTGKWIASLRGEYLGSHATEQDGWDRVDAVLDVDSDKAPDSVRLFGEKWMDERELGGDVRGIGPERSVWKQHIATAKFYDWPLRRVRPMDCQQWLDALPKKFKVLIRRKKVAGVWQITYEQTKERIGKQTVANAKRMLLAVFGAACIAGKCHSNPVADVKMPKMARVRKEEDEWAFLSALQIAALFTAINALEGKKLPRNRRPAAFYRAFYAVAIYGGLRKGEVIGLRWEDVRDGQLKVRHSYAGPVKAESSHRTVPMLRPLRDALNAWRHYGGATKAHGLVFPADHGGCYGKSYDAAWVTQWRAKAKCPAHVRFHDTRHTCASHLVIGTWGLQLKRGEVKDWMGHADESTTERYMHLAPGALLARVRELE